MAELYQGKFSGEEIDSAIEKTKIIQGLPTGGTTGQVVTKTADGAEWANAFNGFQKVGTYGIIDLYKSGNVILLVTNTEITTDSIDPTSSPNGPFTYYAQTSKTYPVEIPAEYKPSDTLTSNQTSFAQNNMSLSQKIMNFTTNTFTHTFRYFTNSNTGQFANTIEKGSIVIKYVL